MQEPSSEEKIASLRASLGGATDEKEIARIKAEIAAEEELQAEIQAWVELLLEYYDYKQKRKMSQ
jgi:hypothetical protein